MKQTIKKLTLHRQTIRTLNGGAASGVVEARISVICSQVDHCPTTICPG